MKPDISIIVPVFNAGRYLKKTLQTILVQSYRNIEVLCINDCSSDNSREVIDFYARTDNRIKCYNFELNRGAPAARNYALNVASGHYVAFVDADDELLPNALIKLFSIASRYNTDAVKGNMLVKAKFRPPRPHSRNHKSVLFQRDFCSCREIHHMLQYQTYIFRLSLIKNNRVFFDEDLHNFQDPVFMARLLPQCKSISLIKDIVYVHNIRPGSISASNWKFVNYSSLILGVKRAFKLLEKDGHKNAALQISKVIERSWYKFEKMPIYLTTKECFMVFTLLRSLYQETNMPSYFKGTNGHKASKILSHIFSGEYLDALKLLKKNNKFFILNNIRKKLYSLALVLR